MRHRTKILMLAVAIVGVWLAGAVRSGDRPVFVNESRCINVFRDPDRADLYHIAGGVQSRATSDLISTSVENESQYPDRYDLVGSNSMAISKPERGGWVPISESFFASDAVPGEHLKVTNIVEGPIFGIFGPGGEGHYVYSNEFEVPPFSGPGASILMTSDRSHFEATSLPLRRIEGETVHIYGVVEEGYYGYELYAVQQHEIDWWTERYVNEAGEQRLHHSGACWLGQMTPYRTYECEERQDYDITVELDDDMIANELSGRRYIVVALLTNQQGRVSQNILHTIRLQ